MRLLAGFKRFFHEQTLEGVLSPGGCRLLCSACDEALHTPRKPLDMWSTAEREIMGRGTVQWQVGGRAWAWAFCVRGGVCIHDQLRKWWVVCGEGTVGKGLGAGWVWVCDGDRVRERLLLLSCACWLRTGLARLTLAPAPCP